MFDDPSMPWGANRYALAVLFVLLLGLAISMDTSLATLAAHTSPRVQRIGMFVTTFGVSGYMFLISAVIAAVALVMRARTHEPGRRATLMLVAERALYFFAAIGISGLAVQVIKHLVGRTRPPMLFEVGAFHFVPFSLKAVFASFPSGHTTTAFAAAVALSFIAPRARMVWIVAAILIGISRVVVHAHYPSDVVAGAALGAGSAFLVARWFARRSLAFEATFPALRIKRLRAARAS